MRRAVVEIPGRMRAGNCVWAGLTPSELRQILVAEFEKQLKEEKEEEEFGRGGAGTGSHTATFVDSATVWNQHHHRYLSYLRKSPAANTSKHFRNCGSEFIFQPPPPTFSPPAVKAHKIPRN